MGLDVRFARRLLRWYAQNRRDLPWRRTRDPYRVWVSEVMLQQTRVDAVVPYYRAFLRAFPDVRALAAAQEEDVLRVWAGLGYYARARHLLRAAREVVQRGSFPTTAAGWRKLPGVGAYTAAAVASIAFGEDVVAVDGNVARVGLRLLGLRRSPRDTTARRAVQAALAAVLPPGRAGELNQALMDLGATVCLPTRPRCTACPVQTFCRARGTGRVHQIPARPPRYPKPRRRFVAAVVRDRWGRVLLVRQPSQGLWGGLWTLPYVEAPSWERAGRLLRRQLGVPLEADGLRLAFRHTFTHFHAHFQVVGARTPEPPRVGRFVRPDAETVPLPAPLRRLLVALRQQRE
ncbi:MAG: A/G-specific adenine glycosylase [Armatimonadota bacterium]|nr:A/G-specific adenine glycosylase [Armatimonadota bacterium]MDW8156932.1 A/G-specific adenine glycosylase [Armatimonadota bacterium]